MSVVQDDRGRWSGDAGPRCWQCGAAGEFEEHFAVEPVAFGPPAKAPKAVPGDVDLLVIGAPTHSRGLPTAATRQKAASAGGGPGRTGVREWLADASLPGGLRVAAFDTTNGPGWLSGSAAKGIAGMLARREPRPSAETKPFVVRGLKGPLRAGQTEAARTWGQGLVRA